MHPNSEKSWAIHRQLHELKIFAAGAIGKNASETAVDLIRQLSELDEWASISVLLRCFFSTDQAVRTAADRALDQVVTQLESYDFLCSRAICDSWDIHVSAPPDHLQAAKLLAFVARFESRSAILGLLSCHYNGYVRQEAVRLLAQINEGIEFPFLLIRQNDWVVPICVEAPKAVRSRINAGNLPTLLRYMPLIVHLRKLSRRDHSDTVQQVIEILMRSENEAALFGLLQSEYRDVRRAIARLALDLKNPPPIRLIFEGLRSIDAVVRFWCARKVREGVPIGNLDSVIGFFQADRYMPVRREGLIIESELHPERSVQIWQRALLDRNPSIRELARFHLRQVPDFQVATYYRESIATHGPSKTTISGLEETGDRTDLPVLREIIQTGERGLRRAAVSALAAVGQKDVIPELVGYLRDQDPGVAKEAGRRLSSMLESVSSETLFDVVMTCEFETSAQAALELIFKKGKWPSLPWLIRATDHPVAPIAATAKALIESWFTARLRNRNFTTPSPSERSAIEAAILSVRHSVRSSFLEHLQKEIKAWW